MDKFKVGDLITGIDGDDEYNITSNESVCEIISINPSGRIIVKLIRHDWNTEFIGCTYTVSPEHFQLIPRVEDESEFCTKFNIPKEEQDLVNNPSHYTQGKYEVIDVIEDWKLNFHEANVVKYVARAKFKGNELQDLKKARFYLDRTIFNLEK